MKQNSSTNLMDTELLSFESIYNKTKNDIFFLSQLIGADEQTAYSLYYSIYNKIHLSIPLPKNINQLNELLDKIIINRSIAILTTDESTLFFEEDEDCAEGFDIEAENITDIPFELISKYINPEFIGEVVAVFSRLPASVRLCTALACFKNTPLERMAKYMGISLDSVKSYLYKAHQSFTVFITDYFGKDAYTPFSFLPLVLQRAEQISSKKNPPPNLSVTFTNAANIKEQKVTLEDVEEFFKDEHTLDLLKEKPVVLEHKTFLKYFSIVLGSIIGLLILIDFFKG